MLSVLNNNMTCEIALNNGDLACATGLLEQPLGHVRVFCQNISVPVTEDLDGWAYWSRDGGVTPLAFGDLTIGDLLYWCPFNGSYWQLAGNENISFDYQVADPTP